MNDDLFRNILINWNLTPQTIKSIYPTAWEIDGVYILKHVKNRIELEKSILFAELLCKEDIPVASYLKTPNGQAYITTYDGYFCLMYKLKGTHLDLYNAPEELPFQLGVLLARLHRALKNIESKTVCQTVDLQEEWQKNIVPKLQSHLVQLPPPLLEYVDTGLAKDYSWLPRQLIHRDPHMGNLLFQNDRLTGYIDFDLSVNNIRLFDLCYFALSLLIGHTEDKRNALRWKAMTADIFHGYETVNSLTDLEQTSVKWLMLYIELLFVAFWMKEQKETQMKETIKVVLWVWENM